MAAVALANKNARVMWALLARGDSYRVRPALDRAVAAGQEKIKNWSTCQRLRRWSGNVDGEPVRTGVFQTCEFPRPFEAGKTVR